MRKPTFFPISHFTIILLVSVLSLFAIDACRKIDHSQIKEQDADIKPTDKFFIVPATADPKVKAIAQSIYRQNQQRNFVSNLVKRVGYPHWDKVIIATKNGINNRQSQANDSAL